MVFGYVRVVPGELLVREYEDYRALYCGVCRAMQKHTGRLSALTLSYDSVFFAAVRMLLCGETISKKPFRCAAHPCKCRHCAEDSPVLADTARAFAILAYGKVEDERADRRGLVRIPLFFASRALRRAVRRAGMPALLSAMQGELAALAVLERQKCPSPDAVFDCTARMLEHFFRVGLEGEAAEIAGEIGYHLGRFIAALDAAEDYEKDKKKGNYNPYLYRDGGGFGPAERVEAVLALREELCRLEEAMLRLPLDGDQTLSDILMNILYLGLGAHVARLERGEEKKKNERPV